MSLFLGVCLWVFVGFPLIIRALALALCTLTPLVTGGSCRVLGRKLLTNCHMKQETQAIFPVIVCDNDCFSLLMHGLKQT